MPSYNVKINEMLRNDCIVVYALFSEDCANSWNLCANKFN